MHPGAPPGHPGLPADLSAAAAAAGLYPQSLGLHNNMPPGLNNYPRGLVSSILVSLSIQLKVTHIIFPYSHIRIRMHLCVAPQASLRQDYQAPANLPIHFM